MRTTITVGLRVIAALLVIRCSTPAASLRYRVTVDVDTPQGPRSGSSVMELVLNRKFLIPMPGFGGADYGPRFKVYGEGPIVPLGDGTSLFTMLQDSAYRSEHDISSVVLDGLRLHDRRRTSAGATDEAIFRELNASRASASVRPPCSLSLARFADPEKPKTLNEVRPNGVGASADQSYSIGGIKIEVVGKDEPLTTALADRFPALAAKRGLLALYRDRQQYR